VYVALLRGVDWIPSVTPGADVLAAQLLDRMKRLLGDVAYENAARPKQALCFGAFVISSEHRT
jgi:hypothetical protein